MARAALVAAALAAACALAVPAARADGDPASDVLLYQKVFLPFNVKLPPASAAELKRIVEQANRRGYTIRVALIGDPTDLGSATPLWRKPQPYASFLSQELQGPAPYTDRVLTAMPNGYGLSRNGTPIPGERRVLDSIRSPDAAREDLATATIGAVQKLAALNGVKLEARLPSKQSGGGSGTWLVIVGAALTLLVVAAGLETFRRVRRRSASIA